MLFLLLCPQGLRRWAGQSQLAAPQAPGKVLFCSVTGRSLVDATFEKRPLSLFPLCGDTVAVASMCCSR